MKFSSVFVATAIVSLVMLPVPIDGFHQSQLRRSLASRPGASSGTARLFETSSHLKRTDTSAATTETHASSTNESHPLLTNASLPRNSASQHFSDHLSVNTSSQTHGDPLVHEHANSRTFFSLRRRLRAKRRPNRELVVRSADGLPIQQNVTDVVRRIDQYRIDNGAAPLPRGLYAATSAADLRRLSTQLMAHADGDISVACNLLIPNAYNVCECNSNCGKTWFHQFQDHSFVVANKVAEQPDSLFFWPGTFHLDLVWDCSCQY